MVVSTIFILEYGALLVSVIISVFLYGATATLSALTTCLTLNWAKLKNLSKLRTEPIQMERLMANVDDVQDVDAVIMRDSWIPQTMALITRIQGIM